MIKQALLLSSLLCLFGFQAETIELQSSTKVPTFVELYTSQGCSSCPPADRLLNKFKKDNKLFKDVIPLAFHVDYWDRLGWKDPFASPENTSRQRQYNSDDITSGVYTPQFVINGKEWKGFFSGRKLKANSSEAGVLSVKFDGTHLTADYPSTIAPLDLHAVILGIGLETKVKRGENRGKSLKQDFVVLSHTSTQSDNGEWSLAIEQPKQIADEYALAVWVSPANSTRPIQAVASILASN